MAFSGNGAGTSGDPYQITNLSQLYEIFDNLTSHFILMNDIDASDTSSGANTQPWNGANGWQAVSAVFSGVLNGDNYSINDLFGRNSGSDSLCFLHTITGGLVKDISIYWNVTASGSRGFGGLAKTIGASSAVVAENVRIYTEVSGSTIGNDTGGFACTTNSNGTTFKNCFSRIRFNNPITSNSSRVGGYVGSSSAITSVVFEDCVAQLYLELTPAFSPSAFGGFVGRGTISGFTPNYRFTRCVSNAVIIGNSNVESIGSFVGDVNNSTVSGTRILYEMCWAVGYLRGKKNIGGLTCNKDSTSIADCWTDVIVEVHDSGAVGVGGLVGRSKSGTATAFQVFRSYVAGFIGLPVDDLTDFGAVAFGSPASSQGVYYSKDATNLDGTRPGEQSVGVGLLASEMTTAGSFEDFDFETVWELGGRNGWPELQSNPYDPELVFFEANTFLYALDSEVVKLDGTSAQFSLIQNVPIDVVEVRFLSGPNSESLTSQVIESPYTVIIEEMVDFDIVYYKFEVDTAVGTISTLTKKYEHFYNDIQEIEIVTPVDSIIPEGQSLIHGSTIVVTSSGEYLFASSRAGGGGGFNSSNIPSGLVKLNTVDYEDIELIYLLDSEGRRCHQFNTLVYAQGYLWTIGITSHTDGGGVGQRLLFRVNPENLEWVSFRATGTIYLGNDSHGTDGSYLYVGDTSLFKLDLSLLIGSYASGSQHDLPGGVLMGTYDHTSQGFHLEGIVPGWSSGCKGGMHACVVDGDYLYAEYTSQGLSVPVGYENETNGKHELHKVRLSDMTPAGYCRIPKCTDDATQDSEFIYLGVEIIASTPLPGALGYRWGAAAVRKSDMALFATPLLDPSDNQNDGVVSYASTIFGNYLVDCKTSNMIYIIDKSEIEQTWQQFNPLELYPNHTFTNKYVGDTTIGVFALNGVNYTGDYPVGQFPPVNEILFDSNGYFHATRWVYGAGIPAPSHFVRFQIPGLSFTAPAVVNTLTAIDQGSDSWLLRGAILQFNGLPILECGFEYGGDVENLNLAIQSSLSGSNFQSTLTEVTEEVYYRAYAINSEGISYGQIQLIEPSAVEVNSPTVVTSSSSVSGSAVTLNGSVTNDGGEIPISSGFYYGTSSGNLNQSTSNDGSLPAISKVLNDLSPGTYYFRAFAQNSAGTGLGSILSFTILELAPGVETPTVTTGTPNPIGTSVTLNGSVVSNGGETPVLSGFYYGTSSGNLNQSTSNDGSLPAISKVLNDLSPGTYYFRAFAQNSAGIGLGSIQNFTIQSQELELINDIPYFLFSRGSNSITLNVLNPIEGLSVDVYLASSESGATFVHQCNVSNLSPADSIIIRNINPSLNYMLRLRFVAYSSSTLVTTGPISGPIYSIVNQL